MNYDEAFTIVNKYAPESGMQYDRWSRFPVPPESTEIIQALSQKAAFYGGIDADTQALIMDCIKAIRKNENLHG